MSHHTGFLRTSVAHRAIALGALALGTLALAGCTLGPDHEPPVLELPAGWSEPSGSGLVAEPTRAEPWWTGFDDPLLRLLVERALAQNLDLELAAARLEQARALRGVAAGGRLPTLDARGAYEHRRESENTPFGEFSPKTDIFSAGVDAAWELDLFGRVRRGLEAADADLAAAAEDRAAVAVSVAAEVALAYVELRAAQSRLAIAYTNVDLQEQTVALVRSRQEAGLVSERDVAQAATNVESTRSRVPTLEADVAAAARRLAVLTGLAPGAPDDLLARLVEPAAVPRPALDVAVGVPAELVRRRPDVRAAERRLAAEVARIGVSEAERYPRFSLAGTLGLASDGLSEFTSRDSVVAGIGPSVRWSLFDGGRLRQRVLYQEARAEEAALAWERTVLLALEEAENAMTRFVREQARRAALERAAAEARRAVELARTQYREGLSDFQAVLDSQRIVAALEDDLAVSDAAVVANLVALQKALAAP
jgi:NodT family efflux transporter outer membrane factor (OMF) lipoprotein